MAQQEDYSPIFSFLCADVSHLHAISGDYLDGAKRLWDVRAQNWSQFLYSCCLLTTTGFELLLKTSIAVDECLARRDSVCTIGDLQKVVDKRLRKCGHNLQKCIEEASVKTDLAITKVETVRNGFVSDYRVTFQDGKTLLFKDSESIRYGSLASSPDKMILVAAYFPDGTFEFLEKFDLFVQERYNSAIQAFRESGGTTTI